MNKKFEDIIAEQGKLVYTNVGNSMFPIVREGDLLIIERVSAPLQIGDVPLYKRDNGQYVLHRIADVKNGKYTMKGDNRTEMEKGVSDRHIIGVLTGIVRNGRTFPVETVQDYTVRIAMDLIYLVSCAVNEKTPDAERVRQMDLPEVYRLSQRHMLTAAVAFALETIMPLPHAFDQAKKKAIRKLSLFDIERTAILHELDAAGIWHLPLKGILLKNDYPKSAMRQMSDNDILCDSTKMPEIRQIMERLGYTCDHYEWENHDTYSKPPVLEFEMHHSLFNEDHFPLYFNYYRNIKAKLLPVEGTSACFRMTDEDFYLYDLVHTYKHETNAGSGLRALLDVYVFLRAHTGMNRAYLDAELKKLHLCDYEEKTRSLSQKLFTGAALDEPEQIALRSVVMAGYCGTQDTMEYNQMAKNLGNDDSNAAKRRFIKDRIFISGNALEKHYPFFAKHKALYPVLLLYRPVKGALTHPKGILKEYKRIIHFKKKEEP